MAEEKEYTEEEILEFIENINLEPLYSEIKRKLKISDLNFKKEIKYTRHQKPYIDFQSNNIAIYSGVLGYVMEEMVIETFSSECVQRNGELFYWMSVHFSWKFKNGGMNGTEMLYARYEKGAWIIEWSYK